MREYVDAIWGWDDDDQRRRFDERFDPDAIQVVEIAGEAAGMVAVEVRRDEVFLAGVELLPRWQGRGVGSAILELVRTLATASHKPVTLQVLRSNPRARALYEREAFHVVGETETHVLMRDG